jgi:hypothetical protein
MDADERFVRCRNNAIARKSRKWVAAPVEKTCQRGTL